MQRALVIQHVEGEGPYLVGDELEAQGVSVDLRRVWTDDFTPSDVSGASALVVMGGPMSVTSTDGFPTRDRELELVRAALALDVPVLGICLGAQLLAAAAGGSVVRGDAGLEVGWMPVTFTASAERDALLAGVPNELSVLHWHGDTYRLPAGAVRLAGSDMYEQQAFRLGTKAWGFQFHAEVDAAACESFCEQFADQAASVPGGVEEIVVGAEVSLGERRAILRRFAQLAVS